jgi:ketosteroid isomerase-like protein
VSRHNIELVCAVHAAFNAGEVEAAFSLFAPDFECDMSRAIGLNVDRDLYDLAGFRRLVDEYASSWEAFELGPEEFLAAGDRVVTPFTNRARGRAGIEVRGRGTFVWTVRDGAVVRACLFQERDEALKAAGLAE